MSHNLNNLLTGVLGPSDLLRESSTDPRVRSLATDIGNAARRARDLIRKLHQTVGGRRHPDIALDIARIVDHALEAAGGHIQAAKAEGRLTSVTTSFQPAPSVLGTEAEVHAILVNLIFNAADAVRSKGELWVEVEGAGSQVVLRVGDSGIGMDEQTRRRVFEPFFTTKMNVGSGLGLYTVYLAVTRMGGAVAVESRPDGGTTFEIRLPANVATPQPAVAQARGSGGTDADLAAPPRT